MTYDEAVNKYLDEHGDFCPNFDRFGRAMYEAGKAASRRPKAFIAKQGDSYLVMQGKSSDLMVTLMRGGFVSESEAKEWARSNGYEVC